MSDIYLTGNVAVSRTFRSFLAILGSQNCEVQNPSVPVVFGMRDLHPKNPRQNNPRSLKSIPKRTWHNEPHP